MAILSPEWRRDPWVWACVAGLVLATAVRSWRIDFDLPQVTDVDADKFVEPAALVAQRGDFRPITFQYPAGYTNVVAALYWIGGIREPYGQNLTARLVSAAAGVGMVAAAWWLVRRLGGGSFAACVAVLVTALSVECVTSSHVASTDTMTACLMTLALTTAITASATWRSWLVAGVLVGLAAGTKFSGAYVGVIVVLAAIVAGFRTHGLGRAARDGGLVCLAAAVAFWLTTPRFPFDFPQYFARLRLEAAIQQFGQLGHVQDGAFDYLVSGTPTPEQPWLYTSLLWNAGPLLLLLAGGALVAALTGRGGQAGVIVAIYVLGYMLSISGPGHLKAARFLLPILPALFALIAWWLERLLAWRRSATRPTASAPAIAAARSARRGLDRGGADDRRADVPFLAKWGPVASATALIAVVGWPAYRTTVYLALLHQPSTDTLLRDWVAMNVPTGSKVFLSPFYVSHIATLPIQAASISNTALRQYRLPESIGPSAEREPLYGAGLVDALLQSGVEYVVLNSYFEDGLAATPENQRWFPRSVREYAGFRAALDIHAELVHAIPGYSAGRSGPDVAVYRLRQ
ncbi:MAG: phospholipid carrier-dependent glycosyltransferase [Planctomycetia bacterium]|nr:phospholipid carrier-dependent glycosyltransferase [Planctomycetia bacterium]